MANKKEIASIIEENNFPISNYSKQISISNDDIDSILRIDFNVKRMENELFYYLFLGNMDNCFIINKQFINNFLKIYNEKNSSSINFNDLEELWFKLKGDQVEIARKQNNDKSPNSSVSYDINNFEIIDELRKGFKFQSERLLKNNSSSIENSNQNNKQQITNEKLISLRINIEEILRISKLFKEAKRRNNLKSLIEEINKIPKAKIQERLEKETDWKELVSKLELGTLKEEDKGNVIITRYKILERLSKEEITKDTINEVIEELKEQWKKITVKNVFRNWGFFGILYDIYYYYYRDNVKNFLNELINIIQSNLSFKDSLSINKVDFDGPQNQGYDEVWFCFYNKKHKTQQTAKQLYFSIGGGFNEEGISYGLHIHNIQETTDLKSEIKTVSLENFNLDKVISTYESYSKIIVEDTKEESQIEMKPSEVQIKNLLDKKKQIILYGPPGTGKTHNINTIIKNHLINNYNLLEKRHKEELENIHYIQKEDVDNNFWWITTNPKIWKYTKDNEEVSFKYGNLKRNYKEIKEGDIVFGYETTPTKKLTWYGKIIQVADDFEENKDEAFTIKVLGNISKDLSWKYLSNEEILENAEPIRAISRGTLFKLSKNEGKFLLNKCNIEESLDIEQNKIKRIEFITFHQSYSYEEFIEGIKPCLDDENISYKIKSGIFKEIVNRAIENKEENFYLVIDEINRGNISKIFGELITLIENDKRENIKVKLPYSQEEFYVPSNLYIIGTMNTSDRSIASLDIALRRRFGFIEMLPDYSLFDDEKYSIEGIGLGDLLKGLNNRIEILLDKDHLIGHSYFLKVTNLDDLKDVWYNEIIPLLEEYFYGDSNKIKAVIGKDFITTNNINKNIFEDELDFIDVEDSVTSIKDREVVEFEKSLQKIAYPNQ